uniref:Uncharacterized protein n=1 Tax=Arundo donax TaxID=35708 RepID=A0A0A9AH94_ARUDO
MSLLLVSFSKSFHNKIKKLLESNRHSGILLWLSSDLDRQNNLI